MNSLKALCVALLCLAAASCSCSSKSAKTKGLSIDELKAKLKSLVKPIDGVCITCDGSGKMLDDNRGIQITCPDCQGKGTRVMDRGATLEEFYKVIGEPLRQENKPGDLIWEYWYYQCSEGLVRVNAYLDEPRGDAVRVVTGDVELVKQK